MAGPDIVATEPPAWELVARRPGAALRGIVEDLAGYQERAATPVRRHELPAARIVLILNLGDPLRMEQADGAGQVVVPQGSGFIAGLYETYSLTETGGQQAGLEVRLSPTGAFRLFGLPMSELANRTVTLDALAPAWSRDLASRLLDAPGWDARFAMVEDALERQTGLTPAPEVAWAWQQLQRSYGQAPVAALVTELGWSHKRLAARFREQIGFTPKQCARLIRFQRVVHHPAFAPDADWCAVAQACGFSDQSHLIREVRAFAGDTPAGLARRRMTESAGFAAGRDTT